VDWSTIATSIGAILTGAGGCALVIREFRRRDRIALKREADALADDVLDLRANLIVCRRYAYHLVQHMADHGIEIPYPEDWDRP
jgi:hypothetical protein